MKNGMRNGLGILRSFGRNVKLKAEWEDDRPKGKAIFEHSGLSIAIAHFKDGLPSGEFSYFFPVSFIQIRGKG